MNNKKKDSIGVVYFFFNLEVDSWTILEGYMFTGFRLVASSGLIQWHRGRRPFELATEGWSCWQGEKHTNWLTGWLSALEDEIMRRSRLMQSESLLYDFGLNLRHRIGLTLKIGPQSGGQRWMKKDRRFGVMFLTSAKKTYCTDSEMNRLNTMNFQQMTFEQKEKEKQ